MGKRLTGELNTPSRYYNTPPLDAFSHPYPNPNPNPYPNPNPNPNPYPNPNPNPYPYPNPNRPVACLSA